MSHIEAVIIVFLHSAVKSESINAISDCLPFSIPPPPHLLGKTPNCPVGISCVHLSSRFPSILYPDFPIQVRRVREPIPTHSRRGQGALWTGYPSVTGHTHQQITTHAHIHTKGQSVVSNWPHMQCGKKPTCTQEEHVNFTRSPENSQLYDRH